MAALAPPTCWTPAEARKGEIEPSRREGQSAHAIVSNSHGVGSGVGGFNVTDEGADGVAVVAFPPLV